MFIWFVLDCIRKKFCVKIFTTLICFLFIVETAAMAVMGFQKNGTVDTDSYFQDTKAITEVKKEYQKNVETRMELISGRMAECLMKVSGIP